MARGPESGLALVDALAAAGVLDGYYLLHATRAELHARLGRWDDARAAYDRALELVTNETERRFLRERRASLDRR